MTRDELTALILRWNGISLAKPYGRAVEEPSACDLLFRQLERFHPNTVKQAIDEEAMEPRPDIMSKRFFSRCLQKQPPSREDIEGAPSGTRVHDRSGFCKQNLLHDRSAFARHVSRADPHTQEFYTEAVRLLEAKMCEFGPETVQRLIPIYRRMSEQKPDYFQAAKRFGARALTTKPASALLPKREGASDAK